MKGGARLSRIAIPQAPPRLLMMRGQIVNFSRQSAFDKDF
jgi:hypothetical protein